MSDISEIQNNMKTEESEKLQAGVDASVESLATSNQVESIQQSADHQPSADEPGDKSLPAAEKVESIQQSVDHQASTDELADKSLPAAEKVEVIQPPASADEPADQSLPLSEQVESIQPPASAYEPADQSVPMSEQVESIQPPASAVKPADQSLPMSEKIESVQPSVADLKPSDESKSSDKIEPAAKLSVEKNPSLDDSAKPSILLPTEDRKSQDASTPSKRGRAKPHFFDLNEIPPYSPSQDWMPKENVHSGTDNKARKKLAAHLGTKNPDGA